MPSPTRWAPLGSCFALTLPALPFSLTLHSPRRWKNSRALKRPLVQSYQLVTHGLSLPGARFHLGGATNSLEPVFNVWICYTESHVPCFYKTMEDLALGQHFHVAVISSSQVAVAPSEGPWSSGSLCWASPSCLGCSRRLGSPGQTFEHLPEAAERALPRPPHPYLSAETTASPTRVSRDPERHVLGLPSLQVSSEGTPVLALQWGEAGGRC